MRILSLAFIILLGSSSFIAAQSSLKHNDTEGAYTRGLELFAKEKYSAAQQAFQEVISQYSLNTSTGVRPVYQNLEAANSHYYSAICALELYNNNAEYLLLKFVEDFPENPLARLAYFQIGKFYFRQPSYNKAAEWFSKVEVNDLNDLQKSEMYFKKGYSYWETGNKDLAFEAFGNARNYLSKFTYPATYYHANILIERKEYDAALEELKYLEGSKNYENKVPYLICRIYYDNNRNAELITYSKSILRNTEVEHYTQINRMVGHAYFAESNYAQASPLLQVFADEGKDQTSQDFYELGFSLYKQNLYSKAIPYLEKVITKKDLFAQNALYVLGECFIQEEKKENARNSFLRASNMDFDPRVKEESAFNYAKLSYELSIQSEAISSLDNFIKTYPNSIFSDKAKGFLSELLLVTKNYREALELLESIKYKTPEVNQAFQQVAFFRGVQLYNDGNLSGAIALFDKCRAINAIPRFTGMANYWRGEAFFQLRKYSDAVSAYNNFKANPGVKEETYFIKVYYNLGYSYFMQDKYSDAVNNFEVFLAGVSKNKKLENDALLRAADCFFVLKDYSSAKNYYNRVANRNVQGSDYGLFQTAMISGLEKNPTKKLETLNLLQELYGNSAYADDALFEKGQTFIQLNKMDEGLKELETLIKTKSNSSYVPRALLVKGLAYYNQSRDEEAIATYKQVLENYRDSEIYKEALLALQNIYVQAGQADEYLNYVSTLPSASVSIAAQDSILFQGTYNRYINGNWNGTILGFDNYLERFPNGFFALDAHFYRGDCLVKIGNGQVAVADFEYILKGNRNKFSEKALIQLGNLAFNEGKFQVAINHYTKLEEIAEYQSSLVAVNARLMRSYFEVENFEKAIDYAKKVKDNEKSSGGEVNLAGLLTAKSNLALKDSVKALEEFQSLAKTTTTVEGAEARFMVAKLLWHKKQFIPAQDMIFEIINQVPSYDNWIVKSYLLLADTYLGMKDDFMARNTLQSIIENYDGQDNTLLDQAKAKLAKMDKRAGIKDTTKKK